MNNKNILLVFFALALAGLACQTSLLGVPVAITTPTIAATLAAPSPSISPAPPTSSPDAGRAGEICFDNIQGGTLRIRECPGLACREIGILTDGDRITATGERKDADGATWLRITFPIDGWVSARYVCEAAVSGAGGE